MRLFKFVIVAISLSVSGCSIESEPDIEVSIRPEKTLLGPVIVVNIQAIRDEVTVKDLLINRGNCKLMNSTIASLSRTQKLKFGQSYQGVTPYCSAHDIKEIQVTTDEGTFEFMFN